MKRFVPFICLFTLLIHLASLMYAQRMVFTPQWLPQAQFAGYYVAKVKGFYKEQGVEVSIQHPSVSNNAINRIKTGRSNLVTLQLTEALKCIDQGVPLINVMQTSQQNSLMIVGHKHIHSIQDLKGKKVGRWRAGFYDIATSLDHQQQLNIEWIPFIHSVNLFVSKAVDATLAMSYNEYFQILSSGIDIDKSNVFYFSQMGYDIPEDGVYVTADYYKENRLAIGKFVAASRKGWQWAEQHPEETLDMVMAWAKVNNVATNREHQKWMLKEILRLQKEQKSGQSTFVLSPRAVKQASDILLRDGIIHKEITFNQIIGQ